MKIITEKQRIAKRRRITTFSTAKAYMFIKRRSSSMSIESFFKSYYIVKDRMPRFQFK